LIFCHICMVLRDWWDGEVLKLGLGMAKKIQIHQIFVVLSLWFDLRLEKFGSFELKLKSEVKTESNSNFFYITSKYKFLDQSNFPPPCSPRATHFLIIFEPFFKFLLMIDSNNRNWKAMKNSTMTSSKKLFNDAVNRSQNFSYPQSFLFHLIFPVLKNFSYKNIQFPPQFFYNLFQILIIP
jgi:hypothetical protein